MKAPSDKWLTDYERRIVTMWSVAAIIVYAIIACAVIGLVMVRNLHITGIPVSVHGESLSGAEGIPTVSSAARKTEPISIAEGVQTRPGASADPIRAETRELLAEPKPESAEMMVENGWDFNAPNGVPGFGPLPNSDTVSPGLADQKAASPDRADQRAAQSLGIIGAASARQADPHRTPPFIAGPAGLATETPGARPTPELLTAIVSWLSGNFDLPEIRDHPRVELVPQMRLGALRYRGLISDRQTPGLEVSPDQARNVVALYNDARRTIYLPDGWNGSPAELSVLVHEMVHHLQNVGGLKYECPQAREKPAYAAQQRWLAMFGLNLLDEFEIDPMTVLVRSLCVY